MQPKVSIVMPVYNVERYVEQSIRSLMEQTLEDIEIIIVNDGSKDGSRDIVGRLAEEDPRIRIIDNVNSGYGVSINRGFAAATGEYLGILESDDFAEPDAYEKLYTAA
ncbi:MAG: glycosyltransferase, partial [Atopobiaceae bacterium]|nr:glycosyltransferase [Atopobiaceae bacterium]